MKKLLAPTLILIASALPALAQDECTAESVQAKALEVSTKMTAMATTDPMKLAELSPRIQEASVKFQDGANLEEACTFYDEILAELGE